MYSLILYLPLVNCFLLLFVGRFLGCFYSLLLSVILLFSAFLCALFAFYEVVICNHITYFKLFKWFDTELSSVEFGFLFDSLTSCMCVVVLGISFLVNLYSMEYMKGDPHIIRFFAYLSLFTTLMLVLVTSDNFIQMFLGWEGVGISSYLLINFWFTRQLANKAALKAVILNRVGDFGIFVGMSLLYAKYRSFDYAILFPLISGDTSNVDQNYINLVCFLLIIGIVGKSAQLGLHTWLPDAMEGPTPVSALIHAATMVTAGVFLILRCSFIFEMSSTSLFILTIFGILTALFASIIGVFQNDLKKVIAYSTCSQLGYMVFICGLSHYSLGLFHLMNHAFFKALLFLSAGSVIHALSNEQDMRLFGGLRNYLPLSYVAFLIGSLALMGFPFLTGFYSKDLILEVSFAEYSVSGSFVFLCGLLAAFFTSLYSLRLLYLTFYGTFNGYKRSLPNIHEGGHCLTTPLIILSIFSIFIGFLAKDLIIGIGTPMWVNVFPELSNLTSYIEAEFIFIGIKLLPLIFMFISFSTIYSFYYLCPYFFFTNFITLNSYSLLLIKMASYKFYVDSIYNRIAYLLLNLGYNGPFKLLDKGILELIGPTGTLRVLNNLSKSVNSLQSGLIFNYIFTIIFNTLIFLLFIFLLSSTNLLDSFGLNDVFLFSFFLFISFFFYNNESDFLKKKSLNEKKYNKFDKFELFYTLIGLSYIGLVIGAMGYEYTKYFSEEFFTLEYYNALNYSRFDLYEDEKEALKTDLDKRIEGVVVYVSVYLICVHIAYFMIWSYDPYAYPLSQEQMDYAYKYIINDYSVLSKLLESLGDESDV